MAFGAIGVALMLLAAGVLLDSAASSLAAHGPGRLQPSELAKPALVIFLAFFVTWRARAINNARYTLVPAALAVGLVILRWWWPTSARPWCWALGGVVFFVAGLEWRYCADRGADRVVGVWRFHREKPYRLGAWCSSSIPSSRSHKFDHAGPHQGLKSR